MTKFWFRYLGQENKDLGSVELTPRCVYFLTFVDNHFVCEVEGSTLPAGEVTEQQAKEMLQISRPMSNRTTIESLDLEDLVNACVEMVQVRTEEHFSPAKPKIPKGIALKIDFLRSPEVDGKDLLTPIEDTEREHVEEALHYIGSKITSKVRASTFSLCMSSTVSTCLMSLRMPGKTKQYIILNYPQLRHLFGNNVSVTNLAQVITHEFAHYISMHGLVSQSDKERFKRALAGRMLHRNQFQHPGYSYPWYEEAWAILAEYMVHGKSARRLSCTDGWEIVEKYFDNNFLRDGVPSGEKLITVR